MFSVLPLSLARACVWPVLCPPAAIAIDSAAIVSAAIVSLVLPAADTVTAPGALVPRPQLATGLVLWARTAARSAAVRPHLAALARRPPLLRRRRSAAAPRAPPS